MRDRNFEWIRKRVFLRPQFMNSMITAPFDEGADIVSFDEGALFDDPTTTGNFFMGEISNLGLVGSRQGGGATDFHFMWHMPYDIDPIYKLGVRIVSSVNETSAAEGSDRRLQFSIIKKDVALANANIDWITTVAINGNGTALSNQRTVRFLIDVASLSRNDIENGTVLALELRTPSFNGTSVVADNIILGLEVDYVPQKCVGEGNTMERSLLTTGIE